MLTTTPTTVLSYAIATNPDPLQVSTTASLTIVAAKRDRSTITYNKLTVKVVSSTDPNAGDALTTDTATIMLGPPPNWTTGPAGELSFTPQSGYGNLQPDDTLMFVLSGIQVNNQVGTTTLTLVEQVTITNSDGSQTPSTQSLTFQLGKFPQGFTLSELTAGKPILGLGDTTTLNWTGSPGNYTLQYGSQSIPIQQQTNLAPYSYPISNLPETTTFNLSVTADGGSVTTQRQCTITVLRPEILSFETANNVTELRTGQPISLSWQTVNATSCDLYINGVLIVTGLPTSSTGYAINDTPISSGMASFVLVAYGSSSSQQVRSVLPVFMYRFDLVTSQVRVGPMPYQLLVRPDNAKLYVACQYPYEFGNFANPINPPLFGNSRPGLYIIDTYNLNNTQTVQQGGAIPNSDPNTQCTTRMAIHPTDYYRFLFTSNQACIVDIDSNNPGQVPIIFPYSPHSNSDIAIGFAGSPQPQPGYTVLASKEGQSLDYMVFETDINGNDTFINFTPIQNTLPISPPGGRSDAWMIWSIVDGLNTLVTLSVAAGSKEFLMSFDGAGFKSVQINNFMSGRKFPPAVTVLYLKDTGGPYCVSGIDTSTNSPAIVIMNQDNQEIRRIPVPAEVRAVVACPDGYHLYATLDDDSIIRMQTGTGDNQVIDKWDLGGLAKPWALAINPAGTRLYVSDVVSPSANGANIPNGKILIFEISDGAF